MAFKKGNPGRKFGSKNKVTRLAKEAFETAFDLMGGTDELVKWAKANRGAFYKLFARLIPVSTQIDGTIQHQIKDKSDAELKQFILTELNKLPPDIKEAFRAQLELTRATH